MNLSIAIPAWNWNKVFMIPKGTILEKGRHGLYTDIVQAAGSVHNRFGCYSWGRATTIFYCGSFSEDYVHGGFHSNLHGRVHNYLQNHKTDINTGRKNTNKMVFDHINEELEHDDIFLRHFTFKTLQFGDDVINFDDFSKDPHLVRLVEQLLICAYHKQNLQLWNRS